jgi:hypothetical protein
MRLQPATRVLFCVPTSLLSSAMSVVRLSIRCHIGKRKEEKRKHCYTQRKLIAQTTTTEGPAHVRVSLPTPFPLSFLPDGAAGSATVAEHRRQGGGAPPPVPRGEPRMGHEVKGEPPVLWVRAGWLSSVEGLVCCRKEERSGPSHH